ncbi:hypothetical protein NM688_g2119 [Phlebia brevispora]|uniref:Uncharacterized protein n=1 Tax=Phlebia brevispora TaxID=194682 RepID=A0ACC1T9D5_9APHY|nr:hypothetical protein NM688_g2119 [Phlebia brevispora]
MFRVLLLVSRPGGNCILERKLVDDLAYRDVRYLLPGTTNPVGSAILGTLLLRYPLRITDAEAKRRIRNIAAGSWLMEAYVVATNTARWYFASTVRVNNSMKAIPSPILASALLNPRSNVRVEFRKPHQGCLYVSYAELQLQPAFDLYRREDEHGPLLAHRFKSLYARSVQIEFLGLWDTVASVGLPSRHLPMFESEGVRYVRHAVALDERRIKFRPHFCYDPAVEREPDKRSHLALQPEDIEQSERSGSAATNTQEVWFAGVHSDIGGGAFDDNELPTPRLSRIPLRWMIRQCFETSTGIVFDACMLREAGLSVSRTTNIDEHSQGVGAASPTYALEPTYDWSPGPLQEREAAPKRLAPSTSTKFRTIASRLLFGWADNARTPDEDMWNYTPQEWERLNDSRDASQDIHCPLKTNPFWWLLELMPLSIETTMAEKLKTGDSYALVRNRGRGRRMFHHTMPGPWKIHRTVKIRLESRPEYIPQARPELTATGHSVRQKIPANRLAHLDWNQNDPSAWNWVP